MKKQRASVKGFTLIELVIVMLIFSSILFGAMQLLDPVTKIFHRTANYEATATAVDNMRNYLEGNVGPVEFLNVYDGVTNTDANQSFENEIVQRFMQRYHANRLSSSDGASYDYVNVPVYVLKMQTSKNASGDFESEMQKMLYNVNSEITDTINKTVLIKNDASPCDPGDASSPASYSAEPAVNPTYFDDYVYTYTLGHDEDGNWKPARYWDFALTITARPKVLTQYGSGASISAESIVTVGLSNILNTMYIEDADEVQAKDNMGVLQTTPAGAPLNRKNVKVKGFYPAMGPGGPEKTRLGKYAGGSCWPYAFHLGADLSAADEIAGVAPSFPIGAVTTDASSVTTTSTTPPAAPVVTTSVSLDPNMPISDAEVKTIYLVYSYRIQ